VKIRPILLTIAAVLATAVACFAADVNVGTWKTKDAKSNSSASVVITAAGDSMKVTIDGIDPESKPFHDEWMGKFDGKDYPLTGDPAVDTRAYKPVNDHTLALTEKKGGKIVNTGRVLYSADGKTRTVIATDANGKKNTTVYDKQ
jgi:hypothetical protein